MEDISALAPDKVDNLLERLSCASLEDLYSAIGGGAIRTVDMELALGELGISKEELGWTTISIYATAQSNHPGVLAQLAGIISECGGNILRSVNDTLPDGGFSLRLVVKSLTSEGAMHLKSAFLESGVSFTSFEIV